MSVDVSIIVVSYNTREMTLACLQSIYDQTQRTFELIVVDNASSDGSADAIRAQVPDLKLLALDENLGFAAANNEAAKHASGRYLLLLNPDTVVLDDAIDKLVTFADAHPDARIWGGRTLFADHSLNPTSCWGRMTLWSLFCSATGLSTMFATSAMANPEGYGGWKRDTVREVDIVTGCFLLIDRDLWLELGGFDRDFFMYGEDADLCLRARAHGARPLITPEATIIHYTGASENVPADKLVRLLRAKRRLILVHWPRWKAPLGLVLLRWSILTRSIVNRIASLLRRANLRDRTEKWRLVWLRRGEWAR